MGHDVFISYSSSDASVAQQACEALEARDIRCWIAPRNILPGMSYAEAIIDAINHSSVMLLVFSARSNRSQHVRREVERAFSKELSILPFKIDGTIPDRDMEYFVAGSHWLDSSSQMHGNWTQTLSTSILDLLARRQRDTRHKAASHETKRKSPSEAATRPVSTGAAPEDTGASPQSSGTSPLVEGWRLHSTPQSILWLNIISDNGRDFHFSLTDSHQGAIVPHERVSLQQETYSNLRGVLADLTNPGRAADPADFAKLGLFLFRLVLPPAVQTALSRHGGPVSFATEELQLPWELLHDGQKFLCLNQPVARQPQTYQVADQLFASDMSGSGESNGRVLIVADPAGDLPSAAAEAEELRGLFHREAVPCDTLIGPRECSYLNIMNRLSEGGYDIIHYCGHACTLPERQCSAIVLANQQLLMAEEICRVMRGHPVAFLNACHSSVMAAAGASPGMSGGVLSSAQNVRSLAQAFVHGNRVGRGRAVIGSMWWLHDDVARGLARNFYEQLLRGQTLGESLRLARCHVEQSQGDPALWSCYVLFGDPLLGWQRTSAAEDSSEPAPAAATKPAVQGIKGVFSDLPDGPPWGDDTRIVLLAAVASMSTMNWSFLSTIHLLLGFTYLDNGILNAALRERDLNPDITRRALRQVLARSTRSSASTEMSLGANIKKSLVGAKRLARDAGDAEVGEQHLLRSMLEVPGAGAATVLERLDVDVAKLLARLQEAEPPLPTTPPPTTPATTTPPASPATTAAEPQVSSPPVSGLFHADGSLHRSRFTSGALAALEAAAEVACATGWEELRGPHVFLGLLQDQSGILCQSLRQIDVAIEPLAEIVATGCRQSQAVGRTPRLHREFLSDRALHIIQEAEQLAGETNPIGEPELVVAMLKDPRQFATKVMQAQKVDLRALRERVAASRPPESATRHSRSTSVAEEESRAPEPLAPLVEQFEYHLAQADWATAGQTAAAIVKTAPQRAVGHLLRSRVSGRQAELEPDAELARQFRHQAIRALERGLTQCSAASEQQPLREAIADLCHEQGNWEPSGPS